MADAAKNAVVEGFESNGLPAVTAAAKGLVFTPTKYVACVTLNTDTGAVGVGPAPCVGAGIAGDPGGITVVFDNTASGITQLRAESDQDHPDTLGRRGGSDEWSIGKSRLGLRIGRSQDRRSAAHRLGTLPARYAPTQCK